MEDFDIKEFAKMFDAALASDNPAVKKAFRNLMIVAALVHTQEEDERQMGPLETLVKKVEDLERLVYNLKNTNTVDTSKYYDRYVYGSNPTWVYNPNTTSGTTYNTSSTSIAGSNYAGLYNGKSVTVEEISDILKELNLD
jgi:hypothetical protein